MKSRFLSTVAVVLVFPAFCAAQAAKSGAPAKTVAPPIKPLALPKIVVGEEVSPLRASPAFAEIVLRKTELRSEVESLLVNYTEEYPKVQEIRYELEVLNKDLTRLLGVKPADSGKLTPALGKLIVRKAELETDLWSLRKKYGDDHPDVKRAKRKVEIYEGAVKDILG